MTPPYRARRTCLAVPGSRPRFLDKARGLAVDEVFLDLADAVAPGGWPRSLRPRAARPG
jgi:citrate lyase beta subunit